jgi:hypothetical protein
LNDESMQIRLPSQIKVMEKVIKFFDFLKNLGVDLRGGIKQNLIDELCAKYNIKIPDSIQKLYLVANGANKEFGEWSWRYWAIDSENINLYNHFGPDVLYVITDRTRGINPHKYLRLFDCLIDMPIYAYCADFSSEFFGEIIGCSADGNDFQAFVASETPEIFFELFESTNANETVLAEIK